jgi:hypothetical protein
VAGCRRGLRRGKDIGRRILETTRCPAQRVARARAEVPDMPDRIIAATAVYFDVPVLRGCPRFETTDTVLQRQVLVLYQGTTLVGP